MFAAQCFRKIAAPLVLWCLLPALWGSLLAQQIKLETVGEDSTLRLPVEGAVVTFKVLEGDKAGEVQLKISDADGTVNCPFLRKAVIKVEGMGYKTLIDTIDGQRNYTFVIHGDAVTLQEQVITGQYAPGSAENSVYKIRVIDQERIQAQGAVNLRDLFTNDVNIRLSQDNALGASMSIQGIPGQNVKILIDGVPVIGRVNGNVDLQQINLNSVERIEIVEGPMSVVYGTDAMGGVINLITKKTHVKPLNAGVNLYYESAGYYNADAYVGWRFGKDKNRIRFTGGRYFFDGWSPGDSSQYVRGAQWKPREQYFATGEYARTLGDLTLRGNGSWFRETLYNRGEVLVTPYYARAKDENFITTRANGVIDLNGFVKKHHHLSILVNFSHFSRIRETWIKDMVSLQEQKSPNNGDQTEDVFQSIMSRGTYSYANQSKKINFQVGYDINMERAQGQRIEDTTQVMGDFAAFASMEYRPVKNLTLRPAVRTAYNNRYGAPVVPSFNLKWDIKHHHSIRFSYARGFRAPSLKELYFFFVDINHNIQGNLDLKAESGHNFNLYYSYNLKKSKYSLRIEPSIYYNHINDWIELAVADRDLALYQYVNISEFRTMGAQLNTSIGWKDLTVELGASVMGRYNVVSQDYSNTPPWNFSPSFRLNPRYSIRKWGLSISAFYSYTGRVSGVAVSEAADGTQTIVRTYTDGYHMLDANINKTFWKNRIHLTVGGKNLIGITNVGSVSTGSAHSGGGGTVPMGIGRTVFVTLRFDY